MEQGNRVHMKLTAEGLVVEIPTKNDQISIPEAKANNYFEEFYANRRLNSELINILKFSKLPNSLQELSTAAHDYYNAKHVRNNDPSFPAHSLRAYLNLLVSKSYSSVEVLNRAVRFTYE